MRRFSGDSYSSISNAIPPLVPTSELPLGIRDNAPLPWCDGPNWVVHLVEKYMKSPLFVHGFAYGGHTVTGLKTQIRTWFANQSKSGEITVDEKTNLFGMNFLRSSGYFISLISRRYHLVTWIGINDMAFVDGPILRRPRRLTLKLLVNLIQRRRRCRIRYA